MGFNTIQDLLDVGLKTDKGCIEWQGVKNSSGYGRQSGKLIHRLAYELVHGPIDNDLCVLHNCDNKICYNPEHLHLGTQAENMKEASQRKRLRRRGVKNLSKEKVIEIITLFRYTNLSGTQISKLLGIEGTVISHIKTGQNHASVMPHVPRPLRGKNV